MPHSIQAKTKASAYHPGLAPQLEAFLAGQATALAYHTPPYLKLLATFLEAEARHWVVLDDAQRIQGFLPAFRRDGPLGPVLNALPFYGSHGAPVVSHERWRAALLEAFRAEALGCWSATMVGSPFDPSPEGGLGALPEGWVWMDERIGQITPLCGANGLAKDEEALMASHDPSARRNVRKAMGLGYAVRRDPDRLPWLIKTHHENMAAVGGLAKPSAFFQAVEACFTWGENAELWVALDAKGEAGAGLLVLLGPTVVEYFTPVVALAHRSDQALALLCHQAMLHYAQAGYRAWNWGGTWHSQQGVYRFKSKFGAEDRRYRYATRLAPQASLAGISPAQLVRDYPYFYTCAFDRLMPSEQTA